MVPFFFASRSAVLLPCIPTCEGTHWKATVLPCLLRSFIVPLACITKDFYIHNACEVSSTGCSVHCVLW